MTVSVVTSKDFISTINELLIKTLSQSISPLACKDCGEGEKEFIQ